MQQSKDAKIIILIVLLFWFAQYTYVPYTTPFLLAQKVGADFVGMVVGAYGAIQFLARFSLGILSDIKRQHRKLMRFGLLIAAIASTLRLIYLDANSFLIANLFSGLSASTWIAFIMLYTKALGEETSLQKAMGYVFAGNYGGIFLAFMVSTLCYKHFGMESLCIAAIMAALLGFALTFLLSDIKDTTVKKIHISDILNTYKNKRLLFFSLITFLHQGVVMGTVMSFSTELGYHIGANDFQVGLITIVYILAGTISCYLASTNLAIRIGPCFSISSVMFLYFIYCIGVLYIENITLFILIQIIAGISCGFVFAWTSSEAVKTIDIAFRSTAIGFYQSAFGGGMTLIPIICGFLIHKTDTLSSAFIFQGIICLITAILTLVFYMIRRKYKNL